MSLLTYNELVEAANHDVIECVDLDHINGASIDVRLGRYVWVEMDAPRGNGIVRLADKEAPGMRLLDLHEGPLLLAPGEFCLAQTMEVFNLPSDIAAEFRLKSSAARAGLDQALAVWCDPGWHGSVLTLELRNNLRHHRLELSVGMKIGQIVLHRGEPVPDAASYATRGQYNGDLSAQPSRGVR
jgi:dCTP deaminase